MSEMNYKAAYERWLSEPTVDAETKAELAAIAENDEEIKQRFISYLSFGTAGLRGTMNAGTNAMNVYTVAHATQGMATLICGKGEPFSPMRICHMYLPRRILLPMQFSDAVQMAAS